MDDSIKQVSQTETVSIFHFSFHIRHFRVTFLFSLEKNTIFIQKDHFSHNSYGKYIFFRVYFLFLV